MIQVYPVVKRVQEYVMWTGGISIIISALFVNDILSQWVYVLCCTQKASMQYRTQR